MNTSEKLRHSHPYRVPDGYFAELRNTLRDRASASAAEACGRERGVWARIRGLAGLSAAFGCLVLLAMVGYYFTGYRAQQREWMAAQNEVGEMLDGYSVYVEDVEGLDEYWGVRKKSEEDVAEERVLFAEAVTDYLATSGYGGGTELLVALTEGD